MLLLWLYAKVDYYVVYRIHRMCETVIGIIKKGGKGCDELSVEKDYIYQRKRGGGSRKHTPYYSERKKKLVRRRLELLCAEWTA